MRDAIFTNDRLENVRSYLYISGVVHLHVWGC